MTTGNPLADVVVGLVLGLVDEGVHALDPAARERRISEAVTEQLGRLHAADPGALQPRLDAAEAARRAELTAAARALREAAVPPVMMTPSVTEALTALLDHHDPRP